MTTRPPSSLDDAASPAGGPEITVVQLYPRDMNIYGDGGNALAVTRRLERWGFTPRLLSYDSGDDPAILDSADILLGGGGQDSGQVRIHDDLLARGEQLRQRAADGVPMLMICGLYQLFGHEFRTREGHVLTGIGVLDVRTEGRDARLIGNVVVDSDRFGTVIGYENHSGQTFLGPEAVPLGRVRIGAGNDESSGAEGAIQGSVIGSYLHGSVLPKNPAITDHLIRTAVERRYGAWQPTLTPDDSRIEAARTVAATRPR